MDTYFYEKWHYGHCFKIMSKTLLVTHNCKQFMQWTFMTHSTISLIFISLYLFLFWYSLIPTCVAAAAVGNIWPFPQGSVQQTAGRRCESWSHQYSAEPHVTIPTDIHGYELQNWHFVLLFRLLYKYNLFLNHYAPVTQANWCNITFTVGNLFPYHSCIGWPESSPPQDSNPGPQPERWKTYQLWLTNIYCL